MIEDSRSLSDAALAEGHTSQTLQTATVCLGERKRHHDIMVKIVPTSQTPLRGPGNPLSLWATLRGFLHRLLLTLNVPAHLSYRQGSRYVVSVKRGGAGVSHS